MILLKIYHAIISTRDTRTLLAVKVFLLQHYKLGSAIFSCLRRAARFSNRCLRNRKRTVADRQRSVTTRNEDRREKVRL